MSRYEITTKNVCFQWKIFAVERYDSKIRMKIFLLKINVFQTRDISF